MKCYYEELGVERHVDENVIKTAYRKLALKWHPDKNPDCMEEAKERFQLIQQAYEVLSDPQERAWYDNHREQILRGKNSEYKDNCLDIFQFFTVSCFKGYGNDDNGFYAVYQKVFEQLAAEDAEFMKTEEEFENIPKFGNAESSYEEIVGPFYAYWSAYCTKRTYTWLCPYDIREIKDRRILREIEKDMKKVVQKAKKERNDEVRSLVSFVRKRDKRVQEYKKLLEERSIINRQKNEQDRLLRMRRRQEELEEMRKNSQIGAEDDDYEEKLKLLEQQYSSDGEDYEEDDESVEQQDFEDLDYVEDLYCVACNKDFKTEKAFANHELSKKHRDNIEKLKTEMQDEEHLHLQCDNTKENGEKDIEVKEEEDETNILPKTENEEPSTLLTDKMGKAKHKKCSKKVKQIVQTKCAEDTNEEIVEEVIEKLNIMNHIDEEDADWDVSNKKVNKKLKNKNKSGKNKSAVSEEQLDKTATETKCTPNSRKESISTANSEITQHICATCKSKFESKNKLFSHLKLTNHGVFIPKTKETNSENTKSKRAKGKK